MQENRQEKSPIKQNILLYLEKKGITQYEFYKQTGVTRGVLGQNNGISEDNLSRFLACYKDINIEWLLTGRGNMIRSEELKTVPIKSSDVNPVDLMPDTPEAMPFIPEYANMGKPIPLVDAFAAAGFGNSDFSIAEQDVKEYYVVPKFKHCKVDFMIEVHGSSMWPKYNSGDVIACSIIKESRFIQWNKCHVIATREQGILVKRIKKAEDPDCLLAISDNKDYDPFFVPLDEITGVALVVGVIRLE